MAMPHEDQLMNYGGSSAGKAERHECFTSSSSRSQRPLSAAKRMGPPELFRAVAWVVLHDNKA
ncbi:hypothetical protein E4U49_002921 [Claviceps purpurea]|nr:hypothetical protein E4U49_002921 [Claviceps purpurea]